MIEREFEGTTARVTLAVGSARCRTFRAPSSRRGGLGEVLPGVLRTEAEPCDELQRVQGVEAMLDGYKAEFVMALAGQRPAEADVPDGAPSAASASWGPGVVRHPDTSEFF